jgi:AcrR family transcriptional regulator
MEARSARGSKRHKSNGPGRPRSASADEAILGAALKRFVEGGIEGANFDQIARCAGVARTTVYRRWSSKEELVAQAIAVARGFAEQEALAKPQDLADLQRQLVEIFVKTATAPGYLMMVAQLIGSVPRCPDLMSVYWHTYLLPRREAIRAVLERARAAGLIGADCDSDLLLDLMSGALLHHLLVRPGKRTGTEMRAYLLRVLRAIGLADPPALKKGRQGPGT